MRKFSVKKTAAVLSAALGITALSAGAAGCLPKSSANITEPDNIEITKLAPPDDGSLPTAHTCAENMAYINYVFDRQQQYHSYSYGVTSASIATQTTRTFRDYKDGVLLTTDLTYSSMVKSGSQTCTVTNAEGEKEVYFRVSETPDSNTLPAQAVWSEQPPTFFSEHSYNYTYGLLPTELFNYIVNEQNIIDSEEVKVNPDGTYTQNFTLDPAASTYFYQFGMKTRGGLSGYPEFESITFSVTFDGGWRILSAGMHEVAKVNKGIVVTSISDFSTDYWYGDDHFDSAHYDFYDSYFKQHIGDENLEQGGSNGEKPVMDVTNVLSNGFSQILNGGAQYELSLDLGNNSYKGYVFVGLDLADPLETLALKLSLGKSLDKQSFFLEYENGGMSAYYGNDFALTANLAEVKLAAEGFGNLIHDITQAFGAVQSKPDGGVQSPAEDGTETADPLAALMDSMVLTAGEKQAVLTLDTDDLLGMGIGVNVRMMFGVNGSEITFRGATLGELALGGEKIDLGLTIRSTTAPEVVMPEGDGANLADYVADVYNLLGSDILKVQLGLHGGGEKVAVAALKNINADVTAYADLDGVAVGAEAKVSYNYNGNIISAEASLWYGYDSADGDWGNAVLWLTKLNGADVNVKLNCNVKELADAVSTAITFAGGQKNAGTKNLVSLLNGALSADFSPLLTEMYADKAQIKIGVSVDTVLEMLGINAGVKFGSCTLKYERGEEVYGGILSATLPALGFNLSVSGGEGEIQAPDMQDCLDLVYAVEDVKELASAELIRANVVLDGNAEGVTLSALEGVYAGLDVYFNAQSAAVGVDAEVSYTYKEHKVSAALSARYADGCVAVSLKQINGVAVAADVYCRTDEITEAVTALLNYANVQVNPFESGEGLELAGVISNLLAADFAGLLPEIYTQSDSLNIAIDCDELLSALGVDLGISLGKVRLAYTHGGESVLVANAPALGLSAGVSGASGKVEMPDVKDYLNLTDLVNTVTAVWKQVDGIIDGQSVGFEIEENSTYLSLDGIVVDIWGSGEVSWKRGGEYVALDLYMAITERATDVAALKLIYDKNAVETPFVRVALNGVGIEIYKDDIDGVVDGFNQIYNKILPLLGGGKTENGAEEKVSALSDGGSGSANDKLMSLIFGVLSDGGWVDFLNGFTLTSDGKSVVLEYLSENKSTVEISAEGGLSLFYQGNFGERFSLGGGITVSPVNGTLIQAVEAKLESCTMSSSKAEGSAEFMRLAYNFLFDAISGITVENILGSDTYTVTFALNGANTNIEQLSDVFIDAKIYITGQKGEQGKLAEGDLNINVKGVIVNLNVISERRGNNTHFYINLNQVADIKLPDLKFMATQDSLYDTLKVIISTVNDTNVIDFVSGMFNGGAALGDASENKTPAESNGDKKIDDTTLDLICNIVGKLLDFNFSKAVSATEADGVTTAVIDLDNIVKQLGLQTGALGKVEAVINHNSHSIKTSGKTAVTDANGNTALKEWISLSSEIVARKDYSKFDRAEYISIEFLPDLIADFVKFATDDEGNVHDKFTLSGNIKANLVNMIDVNIDPCTLTVRLGDGGMSLAMVMHVNQAKVIGIGIPESTVGIAYKNGLLTLAKGLNTSTPEYKVMTFDYFLDHMLTKDDSVIKWLLDISGWNMIMGFVNADINSGLTTPQDISLYDKTVNKEEQEISMYSFVEALRVIIDGKQTAVFGNYESLENDLGVYDNYYGFALNAAQVTGGVLTKLNAAITRSGNGIEGVLASGAVQSYVKFSANLAYRENWTEEYALGTTLSSEKIAPDLYERALAKAEECGYTPDFDYFVQRPDGNNYDEKFGCMSVSANNGNYTVNTAYSHILYSHTLTVVGLNGEIEERLVRDGSTVHLYDNDHPVYTNANKTERLLYSLSRDSVGEKQIVVTGDVTVYAVAMLSATVVVHNGTEEYTVNSFVGDSVPTCVTGLETLGTPTYDQEGTQPVGEGDVVTEDNTVIHIYGKFVKTETVVNYVKYTFSAQTNSYTASGKAAGFNDYYSTKGNTLVLENSIGGYPVTAIAANAFANTEGKPISNVVVPENIVTVGENAFLDNVDMQSAVFLAENVTFLGKDGTSKTMPFYGCSVSGNEEKTELAVYYRNITASGGKWNHFRYVSKVFSYNFYVGDNGGKTYSDGQWQYTDYTVNVNLNGVSGGTLSEEAVKNILSPYFPYAAAGTYFGSAYEAAVNTALEAGLADMEFTRYGITYKCDYTVTGVTENGKTVLTFNVSYKKAAKVYVRSNVDFACYGVSVKADTLTEVTVPVDGEEIIMATPVALATHDFVGWTATEENGETVYNAEWKAKEFKLKIRLTRGGTDTNIVHIDSASHRVNGAGIKGTADVTEIIIYGGEATFTVSDRVLTIATGGVTYTVYVNEVSITGKDKGNKRNIGSDVNGTLTVTENMTLTLSY